jgi:glycyl-tRNA synthetase
MHPTTWKASGHVDAFNDPLIDNKDSKKRYRADVLVEDYVANKIEAKIEKEIQKAAKRFGADFDQEQFEQTNPRVLGYKEKADTILKRLARSLEDEDLADVKALIEELEIACPLSGSKKLDRGQAVQFNVWNQIGCFSRKCNRSLFKTRDGPGYFCEFPQCSKNGSNENPFWYCSNRKGLSK